MLRVNQIKIPIKEEGQSMETLQKKAASVLGIEKEDIRKIQIVRRSVDARKKPDLFYVYTVDVETAAEEKIIKKNERRNRGKDQIAAAEVTEYRFPDITWKASERKHAPVIVGTGPAGLFCGYFLALHGFCPILLERGKRVEERTKDVERFWATGILDVCSNVQFGEGGAGTFSDGKLNTLVKDKDGRNRAVLETFVKFGAKASILYDAKPHIGTDVLSEIVRRMRKEIIKLGGSVRFESRVTDLLTKDGKVTGVKINDREILPCDTLVLAIGHSARDTFSMLERHKVPMEAKAFAVGFRVQHPQRMMNESQYGTAENELLGSAPYKVTAKTSVGRGVYSFCMCPGGYVVNASSEEGMTAVNGMSYSERDGENANSAIIVSVGPDDYPKRGPLSGIEFQRELERCAYECGHGKIPLQRYGEFKAKVREVISESSGVESSYITESSNTADSVAPQCKGGYEWSDLSRILPKELNAAFVEGMEEFGRQIKGFDRPDAILAGVESRTSSAVRILRDESLQSEVKGLYPCGEGAGYAGGITSAAMDGIRVAEKIALNALG